MTTLPNEKINTGTVNRYYTNPLFLVRREKYFVKTYRLNLNMKEKRTVQNSGRFDENVDKRLKNRKC